MRAVVLGYHNVGAACLDVLERSGAAIEAVYTHPDDPAEPRWFDSVSEIARARGLRVFESDGIDDDFEHIQNLEPDILFSFYYRRLIRPDVLAIPRLGAFNMHGSLLPSYRGRCPVNWALLRGELETGVTLHHMVQRPDAGDIVAQRRVPIDFADTALTLSGKITAAAAGLLEATLPALAAGSAPRIAQRLELGSYFGGRGPEDGRIEWDSSARSVYDLVRAVTHPWPGAFTSYAGSKLFVWQARPEQDRPDSDLGPGVVDADRGFTVGTVRGRLQIQRCQLEHEAELDGAAFVERYGLRSGAVLG